MKKKSNLTLEKFEVSKLDNPKHINGGNANEGGEQGETIINKTLERPTQA
ncbi:hypothetical protein HX109_04985 [Galbibacter sp. BG1]|nr:hypothetical protein [Galbibacter sp. BG1]QLE00950.1 hypothetical protein HX109_04985 [Galbibacter sp. BG1]